MTRMQSRYCEPRTPSFGFHVYPNALARLSIETNNSTGGNTMTNRSCSYRDLLMQAAFRVGQQTTLAVEPRCLSIFLGFEALRYRLYLQRVSR
jgi:hypothetical protein